jgi:replicative DNA helicase
LRSYEKRVPQKVFEQPPASIATFLRHLWATDGCIRFGSGYPVIRFESSSERLSRDVMSLLLRLGVNARIRKVDMGSKGRPSFAVTVMGREGTEKFLAVVGAVGDRRQRMRWKLLSWLDGRVSVPQRDLIPATAWELLVAPRMQERSLTTHALKSRIGTCSSYLFTRGLSRERALIVSEELDSDELAGLAVSDVYWDEILSIEPDGQEETYDLTVEGLHNFVAEDMLPHNSLEQDSDLVFFIYRDEYYNEETDQQGLAEVICAKHRNGPTGSEKLSFLKRYAKFADLAA